MDGLNEQLSQFLSDPNSMKQLQSMIGALGLSGGQAESPPAPAHPPSTPAEQPASMPDLSALAGILGSLGGLGQTAQQPAPQPQSTALSTPGPDMLAMVTKLAPLLSQLNQEDDSTRLLRALRPLLGEARRQKIDEAVKILQLMRLLPMLRDVGGLPGLI